MIRFYLLLIVLYYYLLLLLLTHSKKFHEKKKVMKLSFSPLFNSSVSLLHQGCLPSYHLQSRRRMKRLTQFQSHLHSQWALHSEMHLRGHPNIHIVEGQSTCWCSSLGHNQGCTYEWYYRKHEKEKLVFEFRSQSRMHIWVILWKRQIIFQGLARTPRTR